jgi:methylase of polypeptide subunit release factors
MKPDVVERSSGLRKAEQALVELGRGLREDGYHFTTVTPSTHSRVLNRPNSIAATTVDIFGWSKPFRPSTLSELHLRLLQDAGALESASDLLRSTVRFSTLGEQLFVHSCFPTVEADAVFFGPDTYRFARTLDQLIATVRGSSPKRILDIGAGSGAGGLHAAAILPRKPFIVLSDINQRALRFCRVNAALNHTVAEIVESDLYDALHGTFDLIISNPPYLIDALSRHYRHGGGQLGEGLSLAIASQGIQRLAPGGRLLLYTGTAIIGGMDRLHEALRAMLKDLPVYLTYEEIDPDVFGEELDHPPYNHADRLAVVAATIESIA